MPLRDSLQGALPILVLKILFRRGPLHGYGITAQIEGISNEILRVEEGSLYPALHRMEEAGWIKAKWLTTENKRRARGSMKSPHWGANSLKSRNRAGAL